MKNLTIVFKVTLSLLFIGIFSGCFDLNRAPKSELTPEIFWQTNDHAKEAITACYQALKWNETFNRAYGMDCISDIGTGYDDAGYWDIVKGTWTTSSGYALGRWTHSYDGVARTNMVIKSAKEATMLSEEVKTTVTAEAKFLRAIFYFHLLNAFGGVPIYDETVDYTRDFMKMTKERSSEEDTRAFILSDLEEGTRALPVKWTESDYGRATKGAAHALRGKVYLYAKQYEEAIQEFEEVTLDPSGKGYGYALYPNYAEMFLPLGDKSDEMIFSIQNHASPSFNLGMPFAWYMGSNACYGTSWNNVMPSVELVNSYELKDGRPFNWDDFIPGFNESKEIRLQTFVATLSDDKKSVASYPKYYNELLAMYKQRDPRMQQTIILPYTHYLGWVGNKEKNCEFVVAQGVSTTNGFIVVNRGYRTYLFRKFVPEGKMKGLLDSRAHVPINYPLIRYADVLLMLAECYNNIGKLDEAVTLINRVRQRPSTNLPALNSGPTWLEARTAEAIFERIKQERAVEFPAEGLRYYDIKRWGLIEEIQNKSELDYLGDMIYKNKFEAKDYYWPIPLQEIDRNPNLVQNPGW